MAYVVHMRHPMGFGFGTSGENLVCLWRAPAILGEVCRGHRMLVALMSFKCRVVGAFTHRVGGG